jgi:hypothetical protein
MTAAKRDLYIEQGATLSFGFTWYEAVEDPDNPGQYIAGDPHDLTGCIARMQVRPAVTSSVISVNATTENNMITLGGADGTVAVNVPDEETDKVNHKKGSYDLEVEFPDGRVARLLEGKTICSLNTTR